MKLFITGGAGYVGTALCDALDAVPEIDQITVYDALVHGDRRFFLRQPAYAKVRFIHGDLLDTRRLAEACAGHDVVLHLAAHVQEPYHHSQHVQYDQINGYGTLSLVRALEERPEVRRAIYLSSTAVYGFREGLRADSEPFPQNGYGHSKWLGERYFAQLSTPDRSIHVLRSGQIFGVNRSMRFDTMLHAFLFEALTGGCVRVYGDGEQTRAFVPLQEVVQAVTERILGHHAQESEVRLAAFQASVGQILGWLTTQNPSLEFRYLTPNAPFPSQRFDDLPDLDEGALIDAWNAYSAQSAIHP